MLFIMTDGTCKCVSVQGCFATGMTGPTGATGIGITAAYIDPSTNVLYFITTSGQVMSGGIIPSYTGPTGPGGDASFTGATGPTGIAGSPGDYLGTGYYGPGFPNAGTLDPDIMPIINAIDLLRQPNTFYPVQFGLGVATTDVLPSSTAIVLGARADPGDGNSWDNNDDYSIAIGFDSGLIDQQSNAIGIGSNAGRQAQSYGCIALGLESGFYSQNTNSTSIGNQAGYNLQYANSIAMGTQGGHDNQGIYTGIRFDPCHPGMVANSAVYTTQQFSNVIFIGGINLTASDEVTVTNLVTYDKNSQTYMDIFGAGVDGVCYVLYIVNSLLFVGGSFSTANGSPVNNIAAYDITGLNWVDGYFMDGVTIELGAQAIVKDMCVVNDILYVGGYFDTVDGINGYLNIAAFNLSDPVVAWSNPFATSFTALDGYINTLSNIQNILYIGGLFNFTVNSVSQATNVMTFDTSSAEWIPLPFILNDECFQIISSGYTIYMCGSCNGYLIG
jgi:hypothetical protein